MPFDSLLTYQFMYSVSQLLYCCLFSGFTKDNVYSASFYILFCSHPNVIMIILICPDTGELTPHVLNKEIHHLVGKWEVFVQHLPWPGDSSTEAQTQIGIAKKNNPNDVQVQKEAVISNWLSMYPQASWANVVRALQEAEEHTLAKRIQAKYRVELPTRPPVQ